ncbi:F0F1 ATP synthase subunit A [Dinghuibacter silviterrae]|uniref:ATP synthase subunit a n=1 Tax=Dinghuibacter silviterrae TaxID=1539049 RepID=A0A4R8DPV3_9BACT|nr:F0F1 ATP synthase subunit A [Dinghuibacter silviterrae]TDX00134.1 ATP synthase F0 subcomplex A subunit [Dinghuibacter silviterrae]
MGSRTFKSLLVAVFSLIITLFYNTSIAAPGNDKPEHFDAGKEILHHIADGYEFHFFTISGTKYSLPLPVILYSPQRGLSVFSSAHIVEGEAYQGYKLDDSRIVPVKEDGTVDNAIKVYDLSITRAVAQMMFAMILFVWLMVSVGRTYKRKGFKTAPSGKENFLEPIILFIRDEVAVPNLGTNANKFMPLLLTIFFFILVNTLLGLFPGSANVTGNIAVTMSLALVSFIAIIFSSNRHYWGHMFWPPGVPFFVKVILIPVEIVSNLVVKPAALMIRLFANMAAGHIVILSFISMIFIFGEMSQVAGWGFSPVSILFCVFIYFIEILVAFIQSFIFATLTAVFIGQANEGEHDHGGHDDPLIV